MSKVRIPSLEECRSHVGSIWDVVADDWRCPGCGRTKFEVLRWSGRRWRGQLVWHHCHTEVHQRTGPRSRFEPVLVCADCNIVDTAFKNKFHYRKEPLSDKELRIFREASSAKGREWVGTFVWTASYRIPHTFSFSPAELRRFIVARPHQAHHIDYDKAVRLYKEINPPFYGPDGAIAFHKGAAWLPTPSAEAWHARCLVSWSYEDLMP